MVTIATMDFEKSLIMNVDLAILFWRLIDVSVAAFACSSGRHSPVLKFDPDFFVSDGQGSLWVSVRRHFGGSDAILEGREQTCVFHFKQGLNRILLLFKADHLHVKWRAGPGFRAATSSREERTLSLSEFPPAPLCRD